MSAAVLLDEAVAATWPDGTPKSLDNCFTLCADGRPHGFVKGGVIGASATPPPSNRGKNAFGFPDGSIPGLGHNRP